MLSARNLIRRYPNLDVLKGINLDIKPGEIISIVGPSGAGKTTLLQILGTLDRSTDGNLTFKGDNIGGASFDKRIHANMAMRLGNYVIDSALLAAAQIRF